MPSFHCRAILFDMDGTLIDSYDHVIALWTNWGKSHNLDVDNLLAVMPGLKTIDTIRLVAPHLNAEQEFLALQEEEVSSFDSVRLYPGVADLVNSLPSARWNIFTSATRRVAEARLRHVGLPIPETMVTSEQVTSGKPSPDGFILAAQRLGRAPSDCIVLEDAPAGIEAGKAAGSRVIAIASTQPPELLQSADAIIPSIDCLYIKVKGEEIVVSWE